MADPVERLSKISFQLLARSLNAESEASTVNLGLTLQLDPARRQLEWTVERNHLQLLQKLPAFVVELSEHNH